jgi:flagellar assembly protein FliH
VTPQRLKLEVFESAEDGDRPTFVLNGEDLEDTRLAAFEQGYKAGWDDAAATQTDDAVQQRAIVARAIAALEADQAEARRHVLAALRPLIEGMVSVVLPVAAREALPALIADAVIPYAELSTDVPVDLVLNPSLAAAAEAVLLEAAGAPALRIVEDPAVGEGQAFLRHGASETRIDTDAALARIASVFVDYYAQSRKDQSHG